MLKSHRPMISPVALLFLGLLFAAPLAPAQESTLTYQGQLRDNGTPVLGSVNLSFQLYDALVGGNTVGSPEQFLGVPVEDGLFQVELDFGSGTFDGSDRFLEIEVNGAPLNPRQRVTATPYALNVRSLRIEPSAETFSGDPITTNTIAGSSANGVTSGVRGATISGGGVPSGNSDTDPQFQGDNPNRVTDHYGVVGGGYGNVAGNDSGPLDDAPWATVGGGRQNTASNFLSTVGGGFGNTASGSNSFVGGGNNNVASGESSSVGGGRDHTASGNRSTVAGGDGNTASGSWSSVGGGISNVAAGAYSFVVGRQARNTNAAHDGVFMFADGQNASFSSTGANQFLVRASGGAVITDDSANGDPLGNRLRVDGRLRVDDLGGAGTVDLCVNILSQIATCSSSARYKRDIVDLDMGLSTALRLQAVGYKWKASGAADIGFVAEDIAAIDERLITRNDSGEVEGVKYDRLTAVLANAIQEIDQRDQIDDQAVHDLRREVRSLTAQNAALRSEFDAISRLQEQKLDDLHAELAMLRKLVAPRIAEADSR